MSKQNRGGPEGTHQVIGGLRGMLRAGLVDSLTEHKPLERKDPRKFNGPKPAKAGPIKYSDATVAHVRWLHEHEGQGAAQIAMHTGIQQTTIQAWLEYRTRATVEPRQGPA